MRSHDPIGWMWAEACSMLDQAEQLQRQFFRLDYPRGARAAWEPPVDVYENEHEFAVVVALPGVAPEHADAALEGRTLVIRARRQMPVFDRRCSVERMEIPHGYFERRLLLPMPVQMETPRWRDGCLLLSLKKLNPHETYRR